MTQRVADSVIATFARQQHDWMQRVLKGSLDPTKVARAVQELLNNGDNAPTLSIDQPKSFADMKAAGHYDWVNEKITAARFPIEGAGLAPTE